MASRIAAAVVGAALVLVGARAEAQDVFASSGPIYACEAARNHWLRRPDEFRSSSSCCLVWLQQAFAEQVKGLAYFEQASQASGEEQRELVDLGNEAMGRRGDLLAQFRDCSSAVQHALAVAEAGGDATGLMPTGCGGRPKPDEFGSNSGLGSGVADDWYYSRIPDEVREESSCCVRWLRRARMRENRALDAFWESEVRGLPAAEAEALKDDAQKLFSERRKFLLWFSNCVHRVWDELEDDEPACSAGNAAARVAAASAEAAPEAGEQCDNSKEALRGYVDSSLDRDELAKDKITLDPDFEIPDEPDVDWKKWYRDWIKLVNTQVWKRLREHFCSDSFSYWVDMTYEVRPDHTITYTFTHTEGTDPRNGRNFRVSVKNLFDGYVQNKVPAFPSGTSYGKPGKPLRRTFQFRHNASGSLGMTLGGPPSE